MYQRRRARILLAVLVVAAIALVSIDVRGGEDGGGSRVRAFATAVLRPIQDGVRTLVSPIGDLGRGVGDLFTVRSDNQRLRERVEVLEERRRSMTDLERENRELRDLVEIRERLDLEVVGARVVALAPSSFEWTVTIDVGTDDGVARGMPVVDGDGLVGRVIQVTSGASRVLLTIDPNFFAAARSARTGEVGIMNGRGGDPIVFQPLDRDGELAVGDELVTSSYQGGAFPSGIPIGTITAVVDPSGRDARELQVSPFVDFTRLQHVLVVRNAPVEPLPPFDGSEEIELTPSRSLPGDEDDGGDDGDEDAGEDGA